MMEEEGGRGSDGERETITCYVLQMMHGERERGMDGGRGIIFTFLLP